MGWSLETGDLRCRRCLGKLYARLRLPPEYAGWPAGSFGEGTTRVVQICPDCDSAEPSAQGILAFFVLHPTIDEENAADFGALVNEWIANLPRPKSVDPRAFEEDVAAWERGDFDDSRDLGDGDGAW
jgi:hypothetical protein